MALLVTTWFWGIKYPDVYVRRLAAGVNRCLHTPHRFFVSTPDSGDEALLRGCLVRLQMFDPAWQEQHGVRPGDTLVCLDLDTVFVKDIDTVFVNHESYDFKILAGANSLNPCPFNGSLMMLKGGANPQVWREFSLEEAARAPHHEFPDDQAWLHYKLPDASCWQAGARSGVYAFKKPGWPPGSDDLPRGARMVVFPGWRDPAHFTHLPWVAKFWTEKDYAY